MIAIAPCISCPLLAFCHLLRSSCWPSPAASIARLSALELAGIEAHPSKMSSSSPSAASGSSSRPPSRRSSFSWPSAWSWPAVSMLGRIPFIGPIIIGLFFFLFLAVGFVLMLLVLGILGGFNLLYPTIAVEGADAFDAMSRSFAYVYARPWRLLFYTLVSLIYGVITFLFVSFAVYLILLITHTFAGWGTNLFGAPYGGLFRPPQTRNPLARPAIPADSSPPSTGTP